MKILRIKEVIEIVKISRVTIWRFERVGKFPGRVKLGANSVGWLEDEVLEWIASRPRVNAKQLAEF